MARARSRWLICGWSCSSLSSSRRCGSVSKGMPGNSQSEFVGVQKQTGNCTHQREAVQMGYGAGSRTGVQPHGARLDYRPRERGERENLELGVFAAADLQRFELAIGALDQLGDGLVADEVLVRAVFALQLMRGALVPPGKYLVIVAESFHPQQLLFRHQDFRQLLSRQHADDPVVQFLACSF